MPRITRKAYFERLGIHEELQAAERELTLSNLEADLHRQRRTSRDSSSSLGASSVDGDCRSVL